MFSKYCYTLIFILMFPLFATSVFSKDRKIIGANSHYSLVSSYYSIGSGTLSEEKHSSLSDGFGGGLFFEYRYSPHSGLKLSLSMYPNWKTDDTLLKYHFSEMMFEAVLLSEIHFNSAPYNFWVGYGPAVQLKTSENVNNYILNFCVASGLNYKIYDKLYFVPEVLLGANLYLKNEEYEKMVQSITETTDFFNNGFTVSIKLGAGYEF